MLSTKKQAEFSLLSSSYTLSQTVDLQDKNCIILCANAKSAQSGGQPTDQSMLHNKSDCQWSPCSPWWPPVTPCDSPPAHHLPSVNSSQLIENQWLSLHTMSTHWVWQHQYHRAPSVIGGIKIVNYFCKIFSYEGKNIIMTLSVGLNWEINILIFSISDPSNVYIL